MGFKTDIEIAQETVMQPITEIAAKAGIDDKYLEQYGKYKAKIDYNLLKESNAENGKLILVTAINPTPAGEGKTTTTVGLADGMQKLGKKVMVALREPSLGPVFGVKGGAAGGGYAQVVPMEDINLHFTGDFHAIGAANNLLAAMIDNHIFQGNALNIDPRKITWRRCVDMNDRQLRNVVDGLGGKTNGMPREDGYDITVASEIMAVLCLANDITDLKERLARIIIGYTYGKASEQKPVTAGDLNAQGAMAALLKDALKPNLVQTLEHVPAIVHGGPFANIAHGCNSVTATKMAMKLADYTITEAGFGADLGAEKFLDIKCRMAGLKPNAVVIVATVRALKYNGGVPKADLNNENLEALEKGLPNLLKHVSNIKDVYKLPCVVAINAFPTDTKAELDLVESKCKELGVNVALSEVWAKGGEGGVKLAEEVIRLNDDSHQAQEMKMEMNYVKGRYKIAVGEYEVGVSCIRKSIELANHLGEKKMLLNNLKQMIFYGIQVENMEQVKEYVTRGLSILETEERDSEEKGVFTRLHGWYLLHMGRYEEADQVLHQAMKIFRTCAKDEEYFSMSIAACQGYLGDLYRARGDFGKAREFYQSAIELGTGKVVTNGLGQFYSNMGQVLYLEKQYAEAEQYLEKAVSCLKGHGYYWGLERALAYRAMLLWETGEKEQAKTCYEESREISMKIKNPTTIEILKKMERYYIGK